MGGHRVEHVRIPMDDGVELDADLHLPDDDLGPQPCLLEALPYRKDDLTSGHAEEYERLCRDHDYAVCRLDLRGTGSSGGDAVDEYPAREQADLVAVVGWLAQQPWCTGAVGMYGTSYSGFNSLQVAAERPPALKAVVAIYASDDRWSDDVHWRGGQRKLVDLVDYCHYMLPMNALPPDPSRWGPTWRQEWQRRVETTEPWLLTWLAQHTDGPYWRRGSVRPDYDRIQAAVMIVAGWADGYRNAGYRTAAGLRAAGVPHRLLAGPWAHAAPATSAPGPRIDLVVEMVAWWDRWLRGRTGPEVDDGLEGRPSSTLFVRTSTRPAPDLDTHDGFWLREEWPCPRVRTQSVPLDSRPPYRVRADVGTAAWIDCAGHLPWGQSDDQRLDDAVSLCWDLPRPSGIVLGYPTLRLRVSTDRPYGALSVKLCDVFDDGTSALITRGSLDLAFRSSRSDPSAPPVDEPLEVEVELDACAYALAEGHRLRVSVAGSDWPNTVAPEGPLTLTVAGGTLTLPLHPGTGPHPAPTLVAGEPRSSEDPTGVRWALVRDVLRRETAAVVDHAAQYAVPGGTAREHYTGRVGVDTRTFEQTATGSVTLEVRRDDGTTVRARSTLDLRLDAEAYQVGLALVAEEQDAAEQDAAEQGAVGAVRVVGERRWDVRLPRSPGGPGPRPCPGPDQIGSPR